jgi:hypothetical protein
MAFPARLAPLKNADQISLVEFDELDEKLFTDKKQEYHKIFFP